jgi:phosphopantothenoylcysteine decarboxylase/phosphopantothenate--cysteine ligase
MTLNNKRILLVITGGIAAYKSLELIRLITKSGGQVRCILTKGGSQFVTPLSVASLSNHKCYMDLWDLTDESEMGHIRLSRDADLVVIAPASADFMAKMAHGMANDLASTCVLATNKHVMIAPAMNPAMWDNMATQNNLQTLTNRGIHVIAPNDGDMACGEIGTGRMVEANDIFAAIHDFFYKDKPLAGKTAIITSGPTHEPIDPVRYIGNRSSGKQGLAIACALRDAGADVTYITGPTALPNPTGVTIKHIETARQMADAVETALPATIAICAAAVADYGVEKFDHKQKKSDGVLEITFTENPDILRALANHKNRPDIVIGFAAETDDVTANARTKLTRKGCDAIIANHVADDMVFGQDITSVTWISKTEETDYKSLSKFAVADMIVEQITMALLPNTKDKTA